MNLVNFKSLDFSRLSGWQILVDYEGTIEAFGQENADNDSINALLELKNKGNEIFICTNRAKIDERIETLGIKKIELSKNKPSAGEELIALVKNSSKPTLLIGDSMYRDGGLAKKLRVPFMPVLPLGEEKSVIFPASFGCPAPFFQEENKRICVFLDKPSFLVRLFRKNTGYRKQMIQYSNDLIDSLQEFGVKVLVNPPLHLQEGPAIVIGSASKMSEAIFAKRNGFLTKLIAGPGICETQNEAANLLEKSEVDQIVLASQSLKQKWANVDKYFDRVKVILSSSKHIAARAQNASTDGPIVVFADNAPEKIFKEVMKVLWQKKLSIVVSKDAFFAENKYISLLKNAKAALIITGEDDLGRMKSSAWMADVPTLSWLNENQDEIPSSCGRSFKDEVDFESALTDFLVKSSEYEPRKYALLNVSPEVFAGNYIRLINE